MLPRLRDKRINTHGSQKAPRPSEKADAVSSASDFIGDARSNSRGGGRQTSRAFGSLPNRRILAIIIASALLFNFTFAVSLLIHYLFALFNYQIGTLSITTEQFKITRNILRWFPSVVVQNIKGIILMIELVVGMLNWLCYAEY